MATNQGTAPAAPQAALMRKKDIMTDIRATQISVLEGRVHTGFRVAYESVRPKILRSCRRSLCILPIILWVRL